MRWLVALAMLLLATTSEEATAPPSQWDAHILGLEEQAIDAAFQAHVQLLYGNWMKDYHHEGVTGRVSKGVTNAREAYIDAMTKIEARRR